MGEGFAVTCSSCGWTREYMLGVGMAYYSLEAVLDKAVHWRQRGKMRELLEGSKPDFADYEHRLFTCPRCETLYERFYVILVKVNSVLYESRFRCPRCRGRLVPGDGDIARYRCRSCGEKTLRITGEILWD